MDGHSAINFYSILNLCVLGIAAYWLFHLVRRIRSGNRSIWEQPASLAILCGVVCGLFIRLTFSFPRFQEALSVLSLGFLFLTPLILGYLSVLVLKESRQPVAQAIIVPWGATATAIAIAGALGFEGLICMIMALPLWAVLGSIGGLVGLAMRRRRARHSLPAMAVLLLLPAFSSIVESAFISPQEVRTVFTSIDIASTPEKVWDQIKSVETIKRSELPFSLAQAIGFPAPLAATLIGEGIGAVRKATFEGGVLFTETITDWQPLTSIAFSIRANTEQIPKTTLDEHVTIGGPYFDVLNGRYDIVPLSPALVRLELRSSHRLGTNFNSYAGWWSEAIMRSIQETILAVIKNRAEHTADTVANASAPSPRA